MSPTGVLVATGTLFAGTHILLSHPLRAPMVARVGERGFQAVYSLVALATLALFLHAHGSAPDTPPWWSVPDWLWLAATAVMWAASMLLVGSFVGNPAMPGATGTPMATGAFAVTRHPMMWAIALWAVTHLLVIADPKAAILALVVGGLALGGSWGQDAKKRRLDAGRWRSWEAQTSFLPFGAIADGRRGWGDVLAGRGPGAIIGGTVFFVVATWAHGWLGYQPAGLFRYVG